MRQCVGSVGVTIAATLVISMILMYWLVADNAIKSQTQTSAEYSNASISNISLEIKNNSVQLIVELAKPMTCKEVFDALDIADLPLKGKVYSPLCTTVQQSKIIVTYKEKQWYE